MQQTPGAMRRGIASVWLRVAYRALLTLFDN
jgi:hypothetical protein